MTAQLPSQLHAESIRVRGLVQGVGFRPTVWRLAQEYGIQGTVLNDGEGVQILAQAPAPQLAAFVTAMQNECPPLARIDAVERQTTDIDSRLNNFIIVPSEQTSAHTGVVPDAATCPACREDIFTVGNRRQSYAFTNCTHCGPRLSIIRRIPYDRANTTMADFEQCSACREEYENPADRRFHAQPNACPDCGPQVWLETNDGEVLTTAGAIKQAAEHIRSGNIVAIKGIGGIHLACGATNEPAVARLRERKHRYQKPLALMAQSIKHIEAYVAVNAEERKALQSTAAPVVVLNQKEDGESVAASVAPGQQSLGFMLPYSPLHHLLMAELDVPIVLTSGNRSDEPQCRTNEDARERLRDIADVLLLHDRDIANRIDDSVVRYMDGAMAVLRRARGMAPAPIKLPTGFEHAPDLLAMGGELKNTFCLVQDGQAIVSQHMGDLEDARTFGDYLANLDLYQQLFQHEPRLIAIDRHPEYLSSKEGISLATARELPLIEVQHHHAHIAACMADNGIPLDSPPLLGIALDGLGYGENDEIWGGEFLLADYCQFERVGQLEAHPMLGNAQAMREPWRNTYAQLSQLFDWNELRAEFGQLPLFQELLQRPLVTFDAMMKHGRNAPKASSAGRLFDAVAAAMGICRSSVSYEGQAAMEMEACIVSTDRGLGYDFSIQDHVISARPMWRQLLEDLCHQQDTATMAARFHVGLAQAVVRNAVSLCKHHSFDTVALSGGVFQNRTLLTLCRQSLEAEGFRVLTHRQVPANDGGLALGQAVIAAAHSIRRT